MDICLDIDDTITYAPRFFAELLDNCFSEANVTIISFRTDLPETETYLRQVNVRYDKLILSTDAISGKEDGQTLIQWKVHLVNELNPDLFFEDMPEVVSRIRPEVTVFMPCDIIVREWLASAVQTGAND